MPINDSSHLRDRARSLRRLAASVRDCGATQLWRRAGPDTWVGPVAQACHDDLLAIRRRLLTAGDELDAQARRLEADAEAAELAERVVRA